MESYFIAQILLFGGNFAPRSMAFCNGQLLPIDQFSAVFALIGTTYGGNGQTTFALPDFRGRIPVGQGQGPGLSQIVIGQQGGINNVTINNSQLPAHTHTATAAVGVLGTSGNTPNPDGAMIAGGSSTYYAPAANATGSLAGTSAFISPAGGNQPFSNYMPSTGINFIIALEGIFPSRN